MPKELFFKLSELKQKRILDAALEEFSNHDYHSASINRIIAAADISRGSFYQYFTHKSDIYFLVIENAMKRHFRQFSMLVDKPCDAFEYYEHWLRFNLSMLQEPSYQAVFSKLFMHLNHEGFIRLRNMAMQLQGNALKFVAKPGERSNGMIRLLQMIVRELLSKKVFDDASDEEIIDEFHELISIFK